MRGDRPTEGQFDSLLDSTANIIDDRYLLGLRTYDPSKTYFIGDTMVYSNSLYQCIANTTGTFNPGKWQVLASLGATVYTGTWNAQANVPALATGTGTKGFYYVVSIAGTTTIDGISEWAVSDWIIFNGTKWEKVDNSQTPVNATDVYFAPDGSITATNVQDAVVQLRDITDAELTAKQNLITLTPNYYSFADSSNTLADGSILNEADGVVLDSGKVFRSIVPGKSQIDFGGADSVLISTDGGAGAEAMLTMDPGKVTLGRSGYGEFSVTPGGDTNGEILFKNGGGNSISITNALVHLKNNSGASSITIGSDGKAEVTSETLKINSFITNFNALTASTTLYLDSSKNLQSSSVTPVELGYLSGLSSSVQTQLNAKQNALGYVPVPDTRTVNGHPLTANVTVSKTDLGLNNVTNDQQLSQKVYFSNEVITPPLPASSSTVFSTAYTKIFTLVDAGTYLVDWYYEIGSSVAAGDAGARVSLDGAIISESASKPGVAGRFVAMRGFVQTTGITAGSHTFLIEINRPTAVGVVSFRRPRFSLTKI
ncbi:MAG: hypothetical protein M3R17_21380 [Bacteroidota bacterium]|nr:hypothetical protein [Bacteroidota bacterium]